MQKNSARRNYVLASANLPLILLRNHIESCWQKVGILFD